MLAARLAGTLYKQFSKEDQYETARMETTLAIAAWLKAHPRATQHQQQEEVAKQIELFKTKIQNI